ncbi:MAG TPA: IS4 family transposase [Chloroflexota bacterium]|jgi:hypothetical protein|nr:IS4 family transposase [Chloroflexota bacterium]
MAVAAPVLTYTSLLGDRRRFSRLQRLVSALVQHSEASLAQALASLAALKGAYRFFANRAVTPDAILQTARPDCLAKMAAAPRVLLIQDTTDLNFTAHPATTGLGPTGTRRQRTQGLFVHSCLAASTAGVPLGLAAQVLWCRDPAQAGSAQQRKQRDWGDKESHRWLTVEAASRAGLPAAVESVTVADAEADLFALFAAPRPPQAHLLIRVAQPQRCLVDGQALGKVAAQAPVWGHYTVSVQASAKRQARTAACTLRVTPVTLQPPRTQPPGRPWQAPVALMALWAEEEAASVPEGETPLQWLLLTTLPAASFVDAATCVGYYSQRWLIEQYHFLLKTGCQAERLQLRQGERVERAVATLCLVAVRLLWLTYLARAQPDAPCTVAFDTAEWQALCVARSGAATPPAQPPPLREAVRLVAQLGGFLGRRGDGEPGPLTLWRGLQRLADLTHMWRVLHAAAPVIESG